MLFHRQQETQKQSQDRVFNSLFGKNKAAQLSGTDRCHDVLFQLDGFTFL